MEVAAEWILGLSNGASGISSCNALCRFNMLDNISAQDSDERVDIWLVRYAWETRLHYWGLTKLLDMSRTHATDKVQVPCPGFLMDHSKCCKRPSSTLV